jgi:hypothetical protein
MNKLVIAALAAATVLVGVSSNATAGMINPMAIINPVLHQVMHRGGQQYGHTGYYVNPQQQELRRRWYAVRGGGYSQQQVIQQQAVVQQQFVATPDCNPCAPPAPAYRYVNKRHKVGEEEVVVRRPIYENERVRVKVTPPPAPVATAPCNDCAVDMVAIYLGCLIRDGQQFWQYKASNGVVYNMTVERRGPNDQIRLYPDGHTAWVPRG